MRKIISITASLVVMCLMFFACSNEEDFLLDQQTDKIEDIINVELLDFVDGKQKIVTTNYLKQKWERELGEELNQKVVLGNFEILKTIDEKSNKDLFFLKTISSDGLIETGAFLSKENNGSYTLTGKICTCEGCPNGCELVVEGTRCRCTDCSQDTNKSCTKTEQVVIGG